MKNFALIRAAGAVVVGDVKPYALMAGVPVRHIGWMCRHGERLDLPIKREGRQTIRRPESASYCPTAH